MSSPFYYCARIVIAVFSLFYLSNVFFCAKRNLLRFYVGINGDTVYGVFPAYRQWVINSEKVKFIPLSSAEPVVLTAGSCRLF